MIEPDIWYPPGVIYFSFPQVDWLCDYLEPLLEGIYPSEPSSYTNPDMVQSSPSCRAYFETPALIAIELVIRMEACYPDGYLALDHYAKGIPLDELVEKKSLHIGEIELALGKVKGYISYHKETRPWIDIVKKNEDGEDYLSKGLSFRDWLKMHRNRRWMRRLARNASGG